jgi:hypothetical protein
MALGCLFTIIGYILASLSGNPVDAQPQADKSEPTVVDEIVCRKLRVVDENGKTFVMIGKLPAIGGVVKVVDENGKNLVMIGELPVIGGGVIQVYQPNSKFTSRGRTSISGGNIEIYNLDKHSVSIGANSDGGYMVVYDGKVEGTQDAIQLGTNKNGGYMAIFNNGGKNVLQAGVGDMGGGIITTQDKHGYRTGRLP